MTFADFCQLIRGFGFDLHRIKGSHHQFKHPSVPEILTVHPEHGRAKRYQIKEMLTYVDEYDLTLGGDS